MPPLTGHGAALTLNERKMDGRTMRKAIAGFTEDSGLLATEWIVFECSGVAAGQATAFGLLTHGATLCVVGFTMARVELRLSNLMAFHARALSGVLCEPFSAQKACRMGIVWDVVPALRVEGAFVPNPRVEFVGLAESADEPLNQRMGISHSRRPRNSPGDTGQFMITMPVIAMNLRVIWGISAL